MKPGITGLVIPKDWSFDDTIERISAAGYEAFELALRDAGYLTLETPQSDLERIRDRAKAAGIELTSLCPAIRDQPRDLMNADPVIRNQSIALFERAIHVAATAGVDTILVVLGSLAPELFYDIAYENALSSMKKLAPVAESVGVRLAIEYVWNKFLLSPVEFARFCDDVDSPNVGFYFDPGNMAIFSYPEHWVRICGRHLMAAHVKDFKRDGFQWMPLLEGDIDFGAVMRELRALGFDGALVSEVDLDIAPIEKTVKSIRTIMDM